ncbi:HAD-IIB family hydrolase [Bacillus fonticola]|uniref:HAD-IIB family hydrolase n=1 Tax=Bacillus fonticola TaxID=2728853 RepID=UPI0014764528|nr:HAD-IIB family hydrolase [Bacillus fonticola]
MVDRLFAVSIEGTIVSPQGKLLKSAKEAFEFVQQKGIQVTLITSRHHAFARRIAKQCKIPTVSISHHGAFISSASNKTIFAKRVPEDVTYDVVTFLDSFPCSVRCNQERFSVSNELPEQKQLMARAIFSPGDRFPYQHRFVNDLRAAIEDEQLEPLHIDVVFEHPEDARDAEDALRSMFADEIELTRSGDDCLYIVAAGVSKFASLHYVMEHNRFSRDEVVAMGTNREDLDWMSLAHMRVAMGNSDVEVKQNAGWITRSVEEDGAAYMMQEHFRKQQPIEFLKKMNFIE